MSNFASDTLSLLDPQTGRLVVAPSPSGGQGLALTLNGGIPTSLLGSTIGTSFPTNPTPGDGYIYVADSTNGVLWQFRFYKPAGATGYWAFVGGPPLYAEVATSESTTSGSYTDLTTVGPTITLPFAGNYRIDFGAAILPTAAGSAGAIGLSIGGSGIASGDAAMGTATTGSPATNYMHVSRSRVKTSLAATTVKAKYISFFAAATITYQDRWIAVTPVKK